MEAGRGALHEECVDLSSADTGKRDKKTLLG